MIKLGIVTARSMALLLSLLVLAVVVLVLVAVGGEGTAQATTFEYCQPDVEYDWETDCQCPEGTTETEIDGGGDKISGFICESITTVDDGSSLTTDTVTQSASVGETAYATSLPSTGLPQASLLASGLLATGAAALLMRRRRR